MESDARVYATPSESFRVQDDVQLVAALIIVALACMQRLFQVTGEVNDGFQRVQPVFFGARLIFQHRNGCC
ncbi:hypothetical protein LMTR3_35830 [Bradyrhizobium sp. LMTR 3]|nr:hypothetical protein LMTR3_35830 [Bradyrhizobium sp. LMTR 3]